MLFFLVALRMVDDAGGATELWRRYIVEMLIYLPRPVGCEPAKARVRFWREYHGTAITVVAESLAVFKCEALVVVWFDFWQRFPVGVL